MMQSSPSTRHVYCHFYWGGSDQHLSRVLGTNATEYHENPKSETGFGVIILFTLTPHT